MKLKEIVMTQDQITILANACKSVSSTIEPNGYKMAVMKESFEMLREEFVANYSEKYAGMDFRCAMEMRGLTTEQFEILNS